MAWSPFRSETSARGFARKLREQTTHEFEVVRVGPGHYEVGFEFESSDERDTILNAVESVTGYVPTDAPGTPAS
ncbi:MAG: hypothetical protein U5O39_07365 [Gammaproteobacteria bacterium]|nr:hypothetical protein [Gammaproteobacteria bacterium]